MFTPCFFPSSSHLTDHHIPLYIIHPHHSQIPPLLLRILRLLAENAEIVKRMWSECARLIHFADRVLLAGAPPMPLPPTSTVVIAAEVAAATEELAEQELKKRASAANATQTGMHVAGFFYNHGGFAEVGFGILFSCAIVFFTLFFLLTCFISSLSLSLRVSYRLLSRLREPGLLSSSCHRFPSYFCFFIRPPQARASTPSRRSVPPKTAA